MKNSRRGRPPKAALSDIVQGILRGVQIAQQRFNGTDDTVDDFGVGLDIGRVTLDAIRQSDLEMPAQFSAVGVSGAVIGTFDAADQAPRIIRAEERLVGPIHVTIVDARGIGKMVELNGNAAPDHAELVTAGGA